MRSEGDSVEAVRTPLPRSWEAIRNVSRRRSEVAKLRKVVRNGELIKNQEHKARLMFVEKVKRLREMKSLE